MAGGKELHDPSVYRDSSVYRVPPFSGPPFTQPDIRPPLGSRIFGFGVLDRCIENDDQFIGLNVLSKLSKLSN